MWSFFSRDPSKDFPYEIGEPIPGLEEVSLWSLHKAKKKVRLPTVKRRNATETKT